MKDLARSALGAAAAALVALGGVNASAQTAPGATPPCNAQAYQSIRQAIEHDAASPPPPPLPAFLDENGNPVGGAPEPEPRISERFDFACYAVAETCALPESLRTGLRRAGEIAPEERSLLVLRAATEDASLLVSACGAEFPAQLASFGAMDPGARTAAFLAACRPGLEGLAPRAALEPLDFDRLLLAAVVHRWLADNGEPHAGELARLLLGFGLTAPPAGGAAEEATTQPSPGTP